MNPHPGDEHLCTVEGDMVISGRPQKLGMRSKPGPGGCPMTSDAIIAFSATRTWIALGVGAALAALALRTYRRRAPVARRSTPRSRRTERLILALVIGVALAGRVVGWDDALTPPFWFSQVPTLHVAGMLDDGSLRTTWTRLFATTQVGWAHESAVLLPLLAALQSWLGPRFGIPVLAGGFVGTLSVLLAWALGRRLRSQGFGLAFAALVACSPLQATWARLGSYYIAAVPQVLLALLVGHAAGRQSSVFLAAIAGLVAWISLYQYYAARVAIPLAAIAMIAGMPASTSRRRRALLLAVWATTLAGVGAALAGASAHHTLWPAYGGYAGSKGERSIAEFVSRNLPAFMLEARTVPERYFLHHRTLTDVPGYAAGMQYGGLSLVPIALLGAFGLLVVVRNVRRDWLWLAVAAAGLALPVASVTTARRLLVFDLAWCAFAAHGLLGLVDGIGTGWTRRARAARRDGMGCLTALVVHGDLRACPRRCRRAASQSRSAGGVR
jgi:hypothetical protein